MPYAETPSTPLHRFLDKHFRLLAALLLSIMAAAQISSAIQESPTNDEPVHLTAGYVYLTSGVYEIDVTHPPLGRILPALPLLPFPLKHLRREEAVSAAETLAWLSPFSADDLLLRARLVIVALTMLFGAWLAWWTQRQFGSAVALLALTFFAFDPNLIAHGHYVTTDLIASFGIFLACTLWSDFLESPNWWRLTAAGIGLGFALAGKYSAVFLIGVLPMLYAIAWWQKRGQPFFRWRGAIGTLVVMTAGAGLLVILPFVPEVRPAGSSSLPLGYFRGLQALLALQTAGHPAYLLGHFSRWGWWQYFPVALLVKMTTGGLIACGVAALCVWKARRRPAPLLLSCCVAVPPLVYFAVAMRSPIDIGIRHILPIFAFLYVLLAFVLVNYGPLLFRGALRWTPAVLIVLVAAESLSIYPHYLAFFNWPSGGPANGPHYLLDSNIDWGQDLKHLARFVKEHRMTPLCTALFGATRPASYGIIGRDLNETGMPEGVENLPCVVAVSVNLLEGMYNNPRRFAALRQREPVARIGYSVYLYDLRRRK